MKLLSSMFVLVGLVLTLGCAPPLAVEHDYDTTYDFSKLRTFEWMPAPPGDQMEEMTEKRVQGSVNSQLQGKGYTRTAEFPDFLVSLEGIKKTVTAGSTAVGASIAVPVGSHGSVHVGGGKSKPREKQEGTLNLNIVDAKTKTLIWQGTATATIQAKTSPEEQQQRINQVIAELLKSFPPGKGR
jgi:hypothetical protein